MCWFYVVAYFMCGAVNKCAPGALKKVRFCSFFVRLVIKNGEHVYNTSTFVANLIQPVLFYMQSHFFICVRQPLGICAADLRAISAPDLRAICATDLRAKQRRIEIRRNKDTDRVLPTNEDSW